MLELQIWLVIISIITGISITYIHFKKAIKLYSIIKKGKYRVWLIDPLNPRQIEAIMILAKGKNEMKLNKLSSPTKPKLQVVKNEDK